MLDFASSKEGAQIVLSTSSDDDHPPENIIDGLTETFWATTGLYPQEVVIRFKSVINIVGIEITCFYVQRFVVKTSEQDNCDKFEILTERELERNDHHQQREEVKVDREKKAHCLRLLVTSGYDHFAAVYKVEVRGCA